MLFIVFSAMDSHGNSPTVLGPLSDMFSASALQAMSAEEAQDIAERTATSTATATATVEAANAAASAYANLGAEGLPAQHEPKTDPSGRVTFIAE